MFTWIWILQLLFITKLNYWFTPIKRRRRWERWWWEQRCSKILLYWLIKFGLLYQCLGRYYQQIVHEIHYYRLLSTRCRCHWKCIAMVSLIYCFIEYLGCFLDASMTTKSYLNLWVCVWLSFKTAICIIR